MKKNILVKGLAVAVAAGMMTSCADDYLELAPITSVSTNLVTSTETVANATYMGVVECMYCQYSGWADYFLLNGEGWLNQFYGEHFGCDNFLTLWSNSMYEYISNWKGMTYGEYWMCQPGWAYSYTLITRCNNFLYGIDKCEGNAANIAYMKAGILTIRAHAYVKLLQLYAPRWEDANGGDVDCVVLRTDTSTGSAPLAKMKDVMALIESDLNTAISLFTNEAAGVSRGTSLWEPNVDVARGIYARYALLVHDFPTAQKMAHDARQNYPIMTSDEYLSGFTTANGEYMWTNIYSNFIYYWSFGTLYGCNGAYPTGNSFMNGGAINYDLYRQFPDTDIRKELYWTPDKPLARPLKPATFWNPKYINPSNMDMNGLEYKMQSSITGMVNRMQENKDESIPLAYTDNEGHMGEGEHVMVSFGAQFKFYGGDLYGTSQFPFMRAAEMLLSEAEAAYENGDYATATACMNELNAQRDPSYSCTATGEALRDEIRLYRRFELWGEGFNWFDFKRWNTRFVRLPWIEGDETSNNFPPKMAVDYGPEVQNGWRFAIPSREYLYNEDIDRTVNNPYTPATGIRSIKLTR